MCINILKMKNKKAQIQMGESIAILFIFFILVVFGFVFYMNIMKGSAKIEIEENIQLKAIGIAQEVSFLPELQCSEENVRVEDCIDLMKLDAASKLLKDNSIYYYDIFEFSKIWVEEVFPNEGTNGTYTTAHRQPIVIEYPHLYRYHYLILLQKNITLEYWL